MNLGSQGQSEFSNEKTFVPEFKHQAVQSQACDHNLKFQ